MSLGNTNFKKETVQNNLYCVFIQQFTDVIIISKKIILRSYIERGIEKLDSFVYLLLHIYSRKNV